jgi:hypothetical protein
MCKVGGCWCEAHKIGVGHVIDIEQPQSISDRNQYHTLEFGEYQGDYKNQEDD